MAVYGLGSYVTGTATTSSDCWVTFKLNTNSGTGSNGHVYWWPDPTPETPEEIEARETRTKWLYMARNVKRDAYAEELNRAKEALNGCSA